MSNLNTKCFESAWQLIFRLKEDGHLDDEESMMLIHKYLLECCRRIWSLLPDSGSRKGVEAAEKYCSGKISWSEASEMDWYSEASAFLFENGDDTDPDISQYLCQINSKKEEIGNLLVPPREIVSAGVKDLLMDAAYFANEALNFPFISGGTPSSREESMRNIGKFLPLDLLNKMVPISLLSKIGEKNA